MQYQWPISSSSFIFLLTFCLTVRADAPGKLNLYNDYECNKPSTLNPTVSLSLSTCLVYSGGQGLKIDELPPCPSNSDGNGTASHIFYSDPACGIVTNWVSTSAFAEGCWILSDSPDLKPNSKSFMFTCDSPDNNPTPTSTTTAIVSREAAVATGTNDGTSGSGSSSAGAASSATPTTTGLTGTTHESSGSNGASASPSSTTETGGTSSPTAVSQPSANMPSTVTAANGSQTSNTSVAASPSSPASSSGNLATADIIAIAVGVGVGGTTIVFMIVIWIFDDFRHKLRAWLCCHSSRKSLNDSAGGSSPSSLSRLPTSEVRSQDQRWPTY